MVGSLTRSNSTNDIGFMWQPERLNVLLSRARDCLILIGDSSTFSNSPKGASTWIPFFDQMRASGHMSLGLPVKCEKHPSEQGTLRAPEDFVQFTPDGGCSRSWLVLSVMLRAIWL